MAVSHLTELVGRVLAGRYQLLASIGSGASAQVFLAEDVRLRRRVAVKVLHPALADEPTFLKRFRAEAQAAAALNHPNLVAVYDWGTDSGLPFIVTELLQGGSLRAAFENNGRLSLSQTLVVGLEAARGLHYAHSRDFVHRDVKPANLLFGEDRRLRVADFGLARALSGAAWTEPEGVVLGTARYASPEQAVGAVLDGRSDVYSLALVLVECVTGSVPHAADTAVGTLRARVGQSIEPGPELGALAPLLEAAGRAEPAQRWSAAQLGRAFMAVAAELPPPDPITLAAARPSSREHDTPRAVPVAAAPVDAGRSDATHLGGDGAAVTTAATGRREQRLVARQQRRRRVARWTGLGLILAALVVVAVLALSIRGALVSPPSYVLGDYTGAEAVKVAAELAAPPTAWAVTIETGRRDGTTPGQIIDQVPPAGTRLRRGGAVVLTQSGGEELRRVPAQLVNQPLPAATAILVAMGLRVGTTETAFSETVPSGVVLSVKGGEGDIEKGSPVDLVVSGGPQARTLPDFAGQEPAKVKTRLGELGLKYELGEGYSESVARGAVVRTEPEAGQQLGRGETVVVVVSLGRRPITIPDLINRSPSDAATALEDLGLIPEQDGLANRPVIATDPPAGEQVFRGDRVRVISRRN